MKASQQVITEQHDGWEIVATLWAALVGGPSAMKSPALKAMRFPIDAIEADARRDHDEALRRYETDQELQELSEAEAKKKAKGFCRQGRYGCRPRYPGVSGRDLTTTLVELERQIPTGTLGALMRVRLSRLQGLVDAMLDDNNQLPAA